MPQLPRRSFLALIAASAVNSSARTLKPIGVQLYTVRTILPQNPLEVLRALDQIGYREAELTMDNLDSVSAALPQTALKPVSLHLDSALFVRQQDKIPGAVAQARQVGVEYVVCPYVAPQDRGGADMMRRLGETLTRAGESARQAGMRLCYHNHAFDFAPAANGTLLDAMLETADPKLVGLELDIMWAQVAGLDPVSVLKKYGPRVELIHLKNVAPGTPKQYNETVPKTAFREVGNGVIDIPAVLSAAAQAGVKHYFVEQDQTPGDPLASLRESCQYLSKLNY
ncbi:MAG: sugar phosphate isomerase/epimerase [Acidobacteriia bacterium]|nr:sugar phosphate isomerase/epimerase [Terriglobia bacterium]